MLCFLIYYLGNVKCLAEKADRETGKDAWSHFYRFCYIFSFFLLVSGFFVLLFADSVHTVSWCTSGEICVFLHDVLNFVTLSRFIIRWWTNDDSGYVFK